MWVVRHGDDLYMRSMNGRTGIWYRGVQERHEGHIQAGGVGKDITLIETGDDLAEQIDAVYRSKYRRYGERIVGTIVSPQARSATIKLVPRSS
jgi:hypothetical protein